MTPHKNDMGDVLPLASDDALAAGGRASVRHAWFVTLVLTVVCGAIFVLVPTRIEHDLQNVFYRNAQHTATLAARSVGPFIGSRDAETLDRILESITVNEDLVYAAVVDEAGTTVAAFDKRTTGPIAQPQSYVDHFNRDNAVHNIVAPALVNDALAGHVYIGFDREHISAVAAKWRVFFAIAGCLVLVVGFITARVISAVLFDLPSSVFDTLQRITKGDLGKRVSLPATGRLKRLADAFNEMVDNLRSTQEKLERSNRDLEQRAQELHREIGVRRNMETGLLAAIDAAEAADVAKSEFLTNMSHELRTPMTVIISSADLLSQTDASSEQRKLLDMLRDSSDSMMKLINNLLDFSQTDSGNLTLELAEFGLRETVKECLHPFRRAAAEKRIHLAHVIHPRIPNILTGDVLRFRQILDNLVGNAIKFTREGDVALTVDEYGRENGRICLHIAVHDTGVGIAPEKQEMIFEPFTQADGSSTRAQGGTGLGLALTRQLVELMEGKIWVESVEGQGSTFCCLVYMLVPKNPERGEERELLSATERAVETAS